MFKAIAAANVSIFIASLELFREYVGSLRREYPQKVVDAFESRLCLVALLSIGSISSGFSIACFIPNIPPLPSLSYFTRLAGSLTLLLLHVIWLFCVILFRSPWGLRSKDAGAIALAIEKRPGAEKLQLLPMLANNRYQAGDLVGWGDSLRSLRRASLAVSTQCAQETRNRGVRAVRAALNQVEEFREGWRSAEYVLVWMHTLGDIARDALSGGVEPLCTYAVYKLISLSSLGIGRSRQGKHELRLTGFGLMYLAETARFALEHDHPIIVQVVVNGVRESILEVVSDDRVPYGEVALLVLPFCRLVWESSVHTGHRSAADCVIRLLTDIGRRSLQVNDLTLAAVCVSTLQQLTGVCSEMDEDVRVWITLSVLRGFTKIAREASSDSWALVDSVLASSSQSILSRCLPSHFGPRELISLDHGYYSRAVTRVAALQRQRAQEAGPRTGNAVHNVGA